MIEHLEAWDKKHILELVKAGERKKIYEFFVPIGYVLQLDGIRFHKYNPYCITIIEGDGVIIDKIEEEVTNYKYPKKFFIEGALRIYAINNDTSDHYFEIVLDAYLIKLPNCC